MQHAGIPDRRLFSKLNMTAIAVTITIVFNAGVIAQSLSKDP